MSGAESGPKGWRAHRTIEASLARQSFREIVDDAVMSGRRAVITRHGRPVAALVSMRDLERLNSVDAERDRAMQASRSGQPGTMDFEEAVAAAARDPAAVEASAAEISLEQAADEIAGRFMVDYLGPQVTEQAYQAVLALLTHRLGAESRVTTDELENIRAWVIESLWASARVPA